MGGARHQFESASPLAGMAHLRFRPMNPVCANLAGEARICAYKEKDFFHFAESGQRSGFCVTGYLTEVAVNEAGALWQIAGKAQKVWCSHRVRQGQNRGECVWQMPVCEACSNSYLAESVGLGCISHYDI